MVKYARTITPSCTAASFCCFYTVNVLLLQCNVVKIDQSPYYYSPDQQLLLRLISVQRLIKNFSLISQIITS